MRKITFRFTFPLYCQLYRFQSKPRKNHIEITDIMLNLFLFRDFHIRDTDVHTLDEKCFSPSCSSCVSKVRFSCVFRMYMYHWLNNFTCEAVCLNKYRVHGICKFFASKNSTKYKTNEQTHKQTSNIKVKALIWLEC